MTSTEFEAKTVRPGLLVPEPVNEWSLREKLALASAVDKSGDQNWGTVSRNVKVFAEKPRPPDWFSQKNCAVQYNKLLETYEPPKRKRGEQETAVKMIVKNLTAQYLALLARVIPKGKDKYEKKLRKIRDLESGITSDDQVGVMYEKFMKSRARPVEVFDDDDEYTDIDEDSDGEGQTDTEAPPVEVSRVEPQPSSSSKVGEAVAVVPTVNVETCGDEPKIPSTPAQSGKQDGKSRSPLLSEELKQLVHSAIAGTDEKDKNRVALLPGSSTLSMLLELPPRGHGQPLPKIPILPRNVDQRLAKPTEVVHNEVSEAPKPSIGDIVPNPFFRSIPKIDNLQSEMLPGQPSFPAVPDDFLCFPPDDESSKPTDLEVMLKKEELFQISSADQSADTAIESSSRDVSVKDTSLQPCSNIVDLDLADEESCPENVEAEVLAEIKSAPTTGSEAGQLAPLELTELDFQDDAELSVPPPPFRQAFTPSPSPTPRDGSPSGTTPSSPTKSTINIGSPAHSVYTLSSTSSPTKSIISPAVSIPSSPESSIGSTISIYSSSPPSSSSSPTKSVFANSALRVSSSPAKSVTSGSPSKVTLSITKPVTSSPPSRVPVSPTRSVQASPSASMPSPLFSPIKSSPARTVPTSPTTSMASPAISSIKSSPGRTVPLSPTTSLPSPVSSPVKSSPLKFYSPSKSTRSSPDPKSLEPGSPCKDEVRSNLSPLRGRRRLATSTLVKPDTDEPEVTSKEVSISESPALDEKDEEVKLSVPNLRSRRSTQSTPVPVTPEPSSESPTKYPPTSTESRVEVIEDLSEETEFIARVEEPSEARQGGEVGLDSSDLESHKDIGTAHCKEWSVGTSEVTKEVLELKVAGEKADTSLETAGSEVFFDALSEVESKLDDELPCQTIGSDDVSKLGKEVEPVSSAELSEDNTGSEKLTRVVERSSGIVAELEREALDDLIKKGLDDEKHGPTEEELLESSMEDEAAADCQNLKEGDQALDSNEIAMLLESSGEDSPKKNKSSPKTSSSSTPTTTPDVELLFEQSNPQRPLRSLRSRQWVPASIIEAMSGSSISITTHPETSEQSSAEQKKEKRKVKKSMLDLVAKVSQLKDLEQFTSKTSDNNEDGKGDLVREDMDLATLKLRVEANGLDSYDELVRCVNLMLFNHIVAKPEDMPLIRIAAKDFWSLEEGSATVESLIAASAEPVVVPPVAVELDLMPQPAASRSRLSSTSSSASARRSKSGKRAEEDLPARELRKSSQKPMEVTPVLPKGRKSESDRQASPVAEERSYTATPKRKRMIKIPSPEPESPPSPPPSGEAKKLRSRQSQSRTTTPVPPPPPRKSTSTSTRGKRARGT